MKMRRKREFTLTGLGPVENKIMELLWAHGEANVRSVAEWLIDGRQPAYTTVMTIMSRLAEKGLLQRRLVGRAYVYQAAKTKQELIDQSSRAEVRALVRDFGDVALAHFAEELDGADPKRVARLREFLKASERNVE